jgi:hypothetical protein
VAVTADKISAKTGRFHNFIGSTLAVGEFSNGARRGITINLNFRHDKVANSISNRGAGFIGAFAMSSTAFFSQQAKNLFSKLGSWPGEAEKSMDIDSLIRSRGRSGGKTQVKWKAKWPANSRDTANDIGAINGAAVPSISSSVSGFNENSVGATVVSSNGDSFVQKSMKVFDANGLVIATGGSMDINIQNIANGTKKAFESAAIVDNNQTTEANFKEDLLDKKAS